jgi:hypothetical protein
MGSRLIPKAQKPVHFIDLPKSAGILDDFAVRKNVATKEGTIEHVPTEDNHIVNKKYVDSHTPDLSAYWKSDGTSTATGNWNIGANDFNAKIITATDGDNIIKFYATSDRPTILMEKGIGQVGIIQSNTDQDLLIENKVTGRDMKFALTGISPGKYKFTRLTSNGFLKTGSGDGTLSVDTSTYLTSSDLSSYALLDGTNQPFTGNLNVSKADPEIRLTDTGNGEYTRLIKTALNNFVQRLNRVNVLTSSPTGGTITYTDSDGLNPRSSPPYDGGYTVHTFTSNGTFIMSEGSVTAEVLVVGGGGGSGMGDNSGVRNGGGGGAGGLIYKEHFFSVGSYSVVVGNGGEGSNSIANKGSSGGNSIFDGLTAVGGGGGGSRSNANGANGGSGGGGAGLHTAGSTGGTGTQTSQTGDSGIYGFGYSGGNGMTNGRAAGGGGAGGDGLVSGGGDGKEIWGMIFAKGGGAKDVGSDARDGYGDGGRARDNSSSAGRNGGSGVVIIRYLTEDFGLTTQESNIWSSMNSQISGEKGIQTFGDDEGRTVIEGLTTRFNNQGVEKFKIDTDGDLVFPDNQKTYFGTAKDSSITYDGTDLKINPKEIGSGILEVEGTIQGEGYNSADGTPGITQEIVFKDFDEITHTLNFKDGLLTAYSNDS